MTTRDESDAPTTGAVSRRDFFTGAGMTAGAIAALGSAGGLTYAPTAQAAIKDRKVFATNVILELDGQQAGRLLSAEGGDPVIVPDPAGVMAPTLRYETLTTRLGDVSPAVIKWMDSTSERSATSRSAAVIAYDLSGKEIYRLVMQNARVTEITLDKLEASALEVARFSLKIAPGHSEHQFGGTSSLAKSIGKVSPLLQSNFRLYIQNFEPVASKILAVEPVGLRVRADGVLAPIPLKFSLQFKDAGPLFTWMQETLAGKSGLRQAELQLLSRDLAKVAASITFDNLMIVRISCPAESSSGGLQLVEVECQPAAVNFNMGELAT